MSGAKILEGLQDALAYAKGDDSVLTAGGKLVWTEPTMHLRIVQEWDRDVLQQKWRVTTKQFGETEVYEEWRNVPVVKP